MKKLLSLLCVLVFAAASFGGAAAQTAGKSYRVGFLTIGAASVPVVAATLESLARSLEKHGYTVGKNLLIESRFADGDVGRLNGMVKALVDDGADVIVTLSYPAARAAKEGTTTVPIVVAGASDPVETGLVASLSRPGGNITGISDIASELSAKRLELLEMVVPGLKRVAMLFNANDAGMTARYQKASAAAATMGIAVQSLGVREPEDFVATFAAMTAETPGGILMVTDVLTNLNRKRVIEFAAAHRVPAIFEYEYFVREGALMSYGAERSETSERVADLIDRILKGARPADLPFEQPTLFRFVINHKTADALGLTLPASLLERADEVIE